MDRDNSEIGISETRRILDLQEGLLVYSRKMVEDLC